jgi:hypothetical protein
MPGVLERLQEENLHGLERALEDWDSSSADEGYWLRLESRIATAMKLIDSVEWAFESLWERLIADPTSREHFPSLLPGLEAAAESLARAAERCRRLGDQSGRMPAGAAECQARTEGHLRWLEEFLARWELLNRPRKPLNRERAAQARAAYERGEGEAVSDVIARLEQGGPLVKE